MKFTEEQYQKIVEIGEKYQDDRMSQINAIISFTYDIPLNQIEVVNRAIAIANPLTREWAHDKFVEKKYVWTSKKANSSGRHKRLYWQQPSASIRDYFTIDERSSDESELLTESEIKSWGYNPEMFDREEVQ